MYCPSAEIWELVAIRAGLQLVHDCGMVGVEVESDASNVIKLIREDPIQFELDNIISDIHSLTAITQAALVVVL
ncbi:conserved hypothetical protein [Ricinus communis]|uniref:RNase H type-1 domain-containing protein n=1 Tax=Ricinus communis TaxID=3988 RepID=B9SM29_RICCO|nr:conserved hypothetical protein [Ricinus communis]